MDKEDIPFEFIVIDDGSNDNSYELAQALEKRYPAVKAYQLSRNYTSNYAIFAGLTLTQGQCSVILPDDGQPSPIAIVEMYRIWEKGEKMVFLNRSSRKDIWLTNLFANSFYKVMDYLADVQYPPGGTETFLIDREIIDIVNSRIHSINTAIIPELLRLGYNPLHLEYDRPRGDRDKSRWTFKKKMKLAKDIFFSSSSFPIKLISFLGIFSSGFSIMLIVLYSYVKILGNNSFWGFSPPGWTSTVLFISFFSGLILFSLGIIAEYIWRIYEEVKARPGYIIKKKNPEQNGK
ncbi:MAG: glycosyltransferase [Bacteroidetes bacterium]|nr:glycosyltransferase [Bacteroidota bacterium]